ncbi:hypothetical protein Hypma_002536 [Hypsizygus marmoreus]|uniref:Uncharacterized protein n=1 Tax=Hypsizygus marmoreus TaxID=39966 RepID=A0A369J5M0_HYPMA|nr:hypothetical protein Hypma_002536 [Hypsizygus marmoreus]
MDIPIATRALDTMDDTLAICKRPSAVPAPSSEFRGHGVKSSSPKKKMMGLSDLLNPVASQLLTNISPTSWLILPGQQDTGTTVVGDAADWLYKEPTSCYNINACTCGLVVFSYLSSWRFKLIGNSWRLTDSWARRVFSVASMGIHQNVDPGQSPLLIRSSSLQMQGYAMHEHRSKDTKSNGNLDGRYPEYPAETGWRWGSAKGMYKGERGGVTGSAQVERVGVDFDAILEYLFKANKAPY